jgi:hypothetical protein
MTDPKQGDYACHNPRRKIGGACCICRANGTFLEAEPIFRQEIRLEQDQDHRFVRMHNAHPSLDPFWSFWGYKRGPAIRPNKRPQIEKEIPQLEYATRKVGLSWGRERRRS